jgi:hypothetical protein
MEQISSPYLQRKQTPPSTPIIDPRQGSMNGERKLCGDVGVGGLIDYRGACTVQVFICTPVLAPSLTHAQRTPEIYLKQWAPTLPIFHFVPKTST